MKQEKPYGRDAVRKALIEAAASLIAKHGVEGISFRTIAAEARVNHGLITRHFGSKAALVNEVANALVKRLFQDTRDSASTLEDAWNRGFASQSLAMKALLRILMDAETQGAAIIEDSFMSEISSWLRKQEPDDSRLSVLRVNAMLFLTSSMVLGSELVSPSFRRNRGLNNVEYEEVRKEAFRMLVQGLRTGE